MSRKRDKILALVVDDDVTTVYILSEMLKTAGLEVITAVNGLKALKSYKLKKPDIVFCDFLMPEMDGVELMKAIKALNSVTPVILFTGFHERLTARLEKEPVQPDFIMRKPFMLLDKVVEILKQCFPDKEFKLE
jgi:CheY-like chemotaxis protein